MVKRLLFGYICLIALVPRWSEAGTIYVNNALGDDRASGLFPELRALGDGPVATIRRAFEIAHGSDSIVIANTGLPYSESVTLDRPDLVGAEVFPLVIEGNGAVLRGAARLSPDVWRRVAKDTYRYQPYRKGHYQLIVNGTPADEVPVDSAANTLPTLAPMQWCAFRGYVYFRVEPTKFIDQYEFEAPLFDVGLGLHNARNVVVRNLNFEMFRLDGVAVTGNSRNVRLINVRSSANGRAGLSVSGTSQVQVGGIDLSGNRVAERLVLVKGRVNDIPEAQVPPKPAPISWDLKSDRYVRIVAPRDDQKVRSTASRAATERK
jgi:hypothetical protein